MNRIKTIIVGTCILGAAQSGVSQVFTENERDSNMYPAVYPSQSDTTAVEVSTILLDESGILPLEKHQSNSDTTAVVVSETSVEGSVSIPSDDEIYQIPKDADMLKQHVLHMPSSDSLEMSVIDNLHKVLDSLTSRQVANISHEKFRLENDGVTASHAIFNKEGKI